jgi:hypothetical protein
MAGEVEKSSSRVDNPMYTHEEMADIGLLLVPKGIGMPNIDPTVRFWIGIFITVAIGVSSGAVTLTNAIPADLIKPVTAWCGIIAFVGSAVQTTLQGFGMTNQSRLAGAAAIPEVKAIVTSSAMANDAPSNKVVSATS